MNDKVNQAQHSNNHPTQQFEGVVIGVLVGLASDHQPLVVFPGNQQADAISAKSTLHFYQDDIGKEVALLFEMGDPRRPIIIGRLQHPRPLRKTVNSLAHTELDGEHVVLSAERNIVLKCGKSSITLTRAGKIILRGAAILSRSSGVNRIKGGSVQIN
jgi:hypothetical protein